MVAVTLLATCVLYLGVTTLAQERVIYVLPEDQSLTYCPVEKCYHLYSHGLTGVCDGSKSSDGEDRGISPCDFQPTTLLLEGMWTTRVRPPSWQTPCPVSTNTSMM